MTDFADDLKLAMEAARTAGAATLRYFRHGGPVSAEADVREKSHDNPLTKADLEADRILNEALMGARPDYGWLSEETTDDASRLDRTRVWVVDPIDGTKEFISGTPEYAVSIGLVEDGVPVMGCVYNPATDEMFSAARGEGAFLNGTAIRTTNRADLQGARCICSRSETKRGEWKPFESEFELVEVGSIAFKYACLAAGRFDLTFTLTPKTEWDFCAGAAIIREAGGEVSDKDGKPFLYNQPDPKVRSVLASNGQLHAPLLERLKDVPLAPDRRRKK
ncbi:MAG: 3'(2'),5'-bisphosphate nucleotidase CysQ [Magnetococcales bacterium]|nr:3'(2'),5'-bisphosphate nucleotidase CysQ [Magnetococcales bacterium]